jgi:hypothetical protein
MKIKKVVCAALMLSLSMSLLACVPESESDAYEEGAGSPIEVVSYSKIDDTVNRHVTILEDTKTGVEYIYIADGSGCAVTPRLNRNGQPFISK